MLYSYIEVVQAQVRGAEAIHGTEEGTKNRRGQAVEVGLVAGIYLILN